MRLWVDVYDAAGNRLADGPVTSIISASVGRALDGAGTIQMDAPLSDERARSWLTNEARVRIFAEVDGDTRELGRGIIRQVDASISGSGYRLSFSGPDSLDELKRVNTLVARKFNNVALSSVADTLIGLVSGWTVVTDAGLGNVSSRFDGASVLKAFQFIAEEQGLHLRLGPASNTIELGSFGSNTGLLLTSAAIASEEVYDNDHLALIESLKMSQNSEAVANWLLPMGGGEGEAALTLEKSTRTGTYPIQTMIGPDGRTLYYLTDTTSIAAYGIIQKIGVFKNISPIANSEPSMINAADALYDAAAAWLVRNAVRQDTYRVTCRKARQTVRPGDKVHLTYRGIVEKETGGTFAYLDVDDDFWVLKATEKFSAEGMGLDLDISTVDKVAQDSAQIMVGAIEQLELRNLKPITSVVTWAYTYTDTIQGLSVPSDRKDAQFRLKIDDSITAITLVTLQFVTSPLESPVMWYDLTPANFGYRIKISPNWPGDLSLIINGEDVTTELGGPWNVGSADVETNVELDITDIILNAPGGFRQAHSVVFLSEVDKTAEVQVRYGTVFSQSNANNGNIEVTFKVQATAQAIKG